MNTNDPNISTQDSEREDGAADAALLAALSELRLDQSPPRELWSGVEARIKMPAQPSMLVEDRRPSALAAVRTDLAPLRDLWPEIESRIRMQRWRRLRAPLTAAASLAAALVLALGLQVYRGADVPKAAHLPLRASPAVVAAMQEPQAEAALRPVSMPALAPETRALVRANLKIVASAEAQLKRALAADPDAAYLESLLATARQQKQDLRYALAER